jgi:EmrB/QacA subfamily drug resistance transporter
VANAGMHSSRRDRSCIASSPMVAVRSKTALVVTVCLAQFMVVLDATVTNVALPTIGRDLHFSSSDLQWVVTAYTLTFGGLLLLGGRAADLFGRRRLFTLGVSIFTVASLADALARSPSALIISRALQGIGAAMVSPAALSIITTSTAEGAERRRALGIFAAISAGGGGLGLVLGGVLVTYLSWRWVFLVNLPVGAAGVLLARLYVPESHARERAGSFDVAGAILITAGLALFIYAVTEANRYGWGSAQTLGLMAASLGLIAAFLIVEKRLHAPLVRLSIFKIRSVSVSATATFLLVAGLYSNFFLGSLYLQVVKGHTPLQTGLMFLPQSACVAVFSGISQRLMGRFTPKLVLTAGLLLDAAGLAYLSGLRVTDSYLTSFLPGLLLVATGLGLAFVPLTMTATSEAKQDDQGLASGIFNTSQQVGGAVGLAVLAAIASAVTANSHTATHAAALVSGYTTAFAVAAAIALTAVAVVAALLPARRIQVRAGAVGTSGCHVGTRSAVPLEVGPQPASTV